MTIEELRNELKLPKSKPVTKQTVYNILDDLGIQPSHVVGGKPRRLRASVTSHQAGQVIDEFKRRHFWRFKR